MANNFHNTVAEGQSTSRPPLFDGSNYGYWKMRMKNYLIASDYKLWQTIKNGMLALNAEDKYTAEDIVEVERDAKAKNCLYCALTPSEFDKISSCDTAKQIWDKLQVAHEGTSQVKETKINLLVQEYEAFNMRENESISEMFGRFQKVTNGLKNLGETYEQPKLVKKVLRSLPKQWMPKVTAIQEARDLSTLTIEELMGSLMTHEVLMKQKGLEEPKGKRAIALKADSDNEDDHSDTSTSGDDDDEMAMITRRFKSILRKKKFGNSSRNFSKERGKKKEVPTCYNCRKPGHMKFDCPEVDKKQGEIQKKKYNSYFDRKNNNNNFRSQPNRAFKKKKALAAWEMLENMLDDSASEEETEHEAQISQLSPGKCEGDDLHTGISFMAIHEDEVNSETETPNHEELLEELYSDFMILKEKYKETKKELNKTINECSMLKSENLKLKSSLTANSVLEQVKAENTALRKTLTSTLLKMKPKRKGGQTNSKKQKNVSGRKHGPKQTMIWVPKAVAMDVNAIQTPSVRLVAPKKQWVPKFAATNPPGPIPKWVPKIKN